ncbi:MAG: hypothetical protein J5807_05360, partial [Kiritimatiellae bacterium]|nr:hypothetical protein [Kiritimatiellia bacterium]
KAYKYTSSGATDAHLAQRNKGARLLGTRASPSAIPSLRSALTAFGGYHYVSARSEGREGLDGKKAIWF